MARTARRYENREVENHKKIGRTEYYVGIYSRLSVDNDDKKAESVENQIEVVKQYIQKSNEKQNRESDLLIVDVYVDKGKSGTTFMRPGFQRLMDDIKCGKINCIAVKDFSRFGRDYIETGNYIEKILPFLGVRFIAVSDHFDSMSWNSDEGKLAMNIKNLVNDMYAKDISKKVVIARRMSAVSGNFNGSTAPYGYKIIRQNGNRSLIIDREAAKVVRWIFTQYAEGKSERQIADKLYEKRIHRISDYRKYHHVKQCGDESLFIWSVGVIKKIISNQVYVGDLVQGKSSSRLFEGKKGVAQTDGKNWIIVENTHTDIIDRQVFNKIQEMLRDKKRIYRPTQQGNNGDNIYQNLLFCGDCGRKLKSVYNQSRIDEERHYSYYCKAFYYGDERRCSKKYISEKVLNDKLKEVFKEAIEKYGARDAEKKIQQYQREIDTVEKQKQLQKKKAIKLFTEYKEAKITKADYETFRSERERNSVFYEERIMELNRKKDKVKTLAEEEKGECIPLNRNLVEELVERVNLYEEGKLEIIRTYQGGDGNAQ